jgi:hypothetical protein
MKTARRHHYLFAHQILPALFYHDPAKFVDNLHRGKTKYLRFLWNSVGEQYVEAESERMPATALGCQIRKLDQETTAGLIILPLPEETTEAYFVAVVYRPVKRRLFKKQDALVRYITLEYGWNYIPDEPRTVLCEWTAKGAHGNMGDGPEPTLNAFFEAVMELIEG